MKVGYTSCGTFQKFTNQLALCTLAGTLVLGVVLIGWIQRTLDHRHDPFANQMEVLANLPKGEFLRPMSLGYQHLVADVLWLRTLQVLGKKHNTDSEYTWLYHGFDVITELDPQYEYVYWVSGVVLTELAGRPDLSNRLLERGLVAVPNNWLVPYLLAYNNYFYLENAEKAVEYARIAAQISGSPPWMVNMVTQMAAQAGTPEFALKFLLQMYHQQTDQKVKESLEYHIKEVTIERDIRQLESQVQQFHAQEHRYPRQLTELITKKYLVALPSEPFGGTYVVEEDTGRISSSAHPQRLKMYAQPGSEARKRDN